MCGGNDQLDARAVTTALDRIVKAKSICLKEAETSDVDAEQVAATLSGKFHNDLEDLRQCQAPTPRSLLVERGLERALVLNCPECVDDSHAKRSAALIAEKSMRILINHTKKVTDSQEKPSNYTQKPPRKLIGL
ncbi:hypothetical protein HPB50_013789 [Hyalomma asiaticum]|uniref:Uncharacterized protein n=1 Tax=Hyalomma asiaticum TaxID=266040 RepID=A0ACB7TJY6_HYAAI|nr:hypothetical protein HPB50_013789 [Hyalomma asiaticum]